MSRPPGALAIVLHTHMPYVEGFGTWPFGEEWLWEAIAASYLPLLDVLDAAPGRVTLSVTPVLGDQLEAPGALERCATFLREIRPESHRRDLAATRDRGERAALEHSAAAYAGPAADLVGDAARPEHLERAGRRGAGLAPARGGAAGGRRRPGVRRSRCASCWRCRRPTGRSSSPMAQRGDHPVARAAAHEAVFTAALEAPGTQPPAVRNLAPQLARAALAAP